MQICPVDSLRSLIKHFLILESEGPVNHQMFADGNPGIVFHYDQPISEGSQRNTMPGSFLYGQLKDCKHLISSGKTGLVVAVLQPYGIYALTGIPANTFKNHFIALTDVLGHQTRALEEQILNSSTSAERIGILETFFIKKYSSLHPIDPHIRHALELICTHKGLLPIAWINEKLNITERQLERKFNTQIGTSPKYLSGIVKIHHTLKLFQYTPVSNTAQVACEAGYFDQAHFIHDFKKIAGVSPLKYLSHNHRLAVNLFPAEV
ncbi:helix-turn-helix domain-containing protein [Pedobacter nutrimenti]|uniref:helix-turn-helix domain-containing protein n=1 Tax=Pedobacter nutrimenti TaxID=1241337 RepID=UPI002931E622|nr:helix-turn-helix domain-containing protein [Pedobacter nutrimenti]